ncbi:MAG TPA: hypothetical protein PLG97_12410 [Alcaligenes sp.]|nr:hypothetical protein [Alcaligenes sp.]HRL28317.1 hypothetical protein [Alcaligenes sp.]
MAHIVIIVGLYVLIAGMLGLVLYHTRPASWRRDTALLMITPLAVPLFYAAIVLLKG